jgi:hypothetical protein
MRRKVIHLRAMRPCNGRTVCGVEIEQKGYSLYSGPSVSKVKVSKVWKNVNCKNCLSKKRWEKGQYENNR